MIVLTAQADRGRLERGESHQVIDLEALFRPVSKRSQLIRIPAEIPGIVAEAVRLASAPRPGPVHLSLPEDVAGQETAAPPLALPQRASGLPDPQAIVTASQALKAASNVVIVAGAGALRDKAAVSVKHFAESVALPLVTTFMGNGILPPDHELCLFTIGQPFKDPIDDTLKAADLVLAIGYDPVEYPPEKLDCPVLTIGETPAALDAGWQVIADLPGDIAASLNALSSVLDGRQFGLFDAAIDTRDQMRHLRHTGEAGSPEHILAQIESLLTVDDTVLSGVGKHKLKIARSLAAKRPGQIIIPNGLAGMGLALPGAAAAARLQESGRVLAICGDGDAMMNIQELETIKRLDLPVTLMIWQDNAYGLITAKLQDETGRQTGLSFCSPNWADLARSFGWAHAHVDKGDSLSDAWNTKARQLMMTVDVDYQSGLSPD